MRTTRFGLLLLGCLIGLPLAACAAEDAGDAEVEATDESALATSAASAQKAGDISTQAQCGTTWDSRYVETPGDAVGMQPRFVSYHETRVGFHVRGHCSGTLISDDLFLSAGNCGYAVGDQVRFNYQLSPDGWYRATSEFAVTQIVEQQNDASWDYAIVRLAGSPGREFGHANLTNEAPGSNDTVTIISHPFQLKEVHAGPLVSVPPSRGPNWFSYFVDLDTGSRGAGVLDSKGRLIGVHTNGNCFVGTPMRGNEGMRMSSLVAHSPTLTTLTQNKILWRYLNTAEISVWNVNASGALTSAFGHETGSAWAPLSYSNNQLTWKNSNNDISVWNLDNAGTLLSAVASVAPYRWRPVSSAQGRVLWHHALTNSIRVWTVDAAGSYQSHVDHSILEGWTPVNYANNHILWRHTSGQFSVWRVDDAGNFLSTSETFYVGPGWFPVSYDNGQLLLKNGGSGVGIWTLNRDNVVLTKQYYEVGAGWTALAMADRQLIWRHTSGLLSVWRVSDIGVLLGDIGHNVDPNWKPVTITGAR